MKVENTSGETGVVGHNFIIIIVTILVPKNVCIF